MSQLLIIGIDGGTWTVLDDAISQGYMPILAKLKNKNQSGILRSTKPPVTPAAWAAFHTGNNSSHHGIIDFIVWDRNQNQPIPVDSNYLPQTWWQKLSKKGKSIGLINLPLTYPPQSINGCIISGILTPKKDSQWTYPKELKNEILSVVPEYQPVVFNIPSAREVAAKPLEFGSLVKKQIKLKEKIVLWLIKQKQLDLLTIHFQIIDWAQHALWPYLDKSHASFNKSIQRNIYKKVYQALDDSIAKLWSAWKNKSLDPQLILLSDHGFQKHKKQILLGNLFYNKKILDQRAGTKRQLNKLIAKTGLLLTSTSPFELIGKNGWGQIYLNPGFKLKEVLRIITPVCMGLKDKCGQPVLKKIHTTAELYGKGRQSKYLPEIIIEPQAGYSITAAIDKTGVFFKDVKLGKDFHLGVHHPDGIILSTHNSKLPTNIEKVASYLMSIV